MSWAVSTIIQNMYLAKTDYEGLMTFWGGKIILTLLILFIGFKISKIIGKLVGKAMDKKDIDPTLKPFIVSMATMTLKILVVVSAMGTLGVEATSFAALIAAVGLAVGMALSGTLQNFAGGVILLILRPFKVGDVIEAQGYTGKVEAIQIFQTILLTPDNKMVHVPNGKLSNDSLINYSTMPTRRVDFSFGIGYGDNIDQAREVIQGVINSINTIHSSPEPMIKVGELADSSVNFTVRVWSDSADYWDIYFAMTEQVKKALDEAGISIPFPQQDVYMHQA